GQFREYLERNTYINQVLGTGYAPLQGFSSNLYRPYQGRAGGKKSGVLVRQRLEREGLSSATKTHNVTSPELNDAWEVVD
ncbi:hypothetical protein KXV52_000993, partial [Aspergillus fumigatus]